MQGTELTDSLRKLSADSVHSCRCSGSAADFNSSRVICWSEQAGQSTGEFPQWRGEEEEPGKRVIGWKTFSGCYLAGSQGCWGNDQCGGEAHSEAPPGWEEPETPFTDWSLVSSASLCCRRPFLYALWITVAATSSCFLCRVLLIGSYDTCR